MVAPGIPAGTRSYALYGTEAASALATGQLLRTGIDDDIARHDPVHPGLLHVRSFLDDLARKIALKKVMGKKKPQREQMNSPDDEELPVHMAPRDSFAKEEVNYRYSGKPDHMCGACQYFVQPGACELVAGLIRPVDVCDRFELRPEGPDVPAVRARMTEQVAEAEPNSALAEQGLFDGFDDADSCPNEVRDADCQCPHNPLYDEFTQGECQRGDNDDGGDEFLGEATPAFPGSGGMNRNGGVVGSPRLPTPSGGMNRERREGRVVHFAGKHEGNIVHFEPHKFHSRSQEVSPPGWGGTVKAMKKYMVTEALMAVAEAMLADLGEQKKQKRITNPWALAWWMKKRGYTPHKPDTASEVKTVRAALA